MIILVNAQKSFHRIQYIFVTKGQKTFLRKLGKEQIKPTVRKRKEGTNRRTEINDTEVIKTIES